MKKKGIKQEENLMKIVNKDGTSLKRLELEDENYWKNRPLTDKRRDWYEQGDNWIEDYVLSVNHPHRQLILDALAKLEPFAGVLEIGCNAGPNLKRIQDKYPETQMAGIDVNEKAIERAKKLLPNAVLKVGDATHVPFDDKSFDVLIYDAILIYVDPINFVNKVLVEMNRLARKAIILVEWADESLSGVVKDGHWTRNYGKILEQMGFKVESLKINEETWPNKSKNWVRNGYVWLAVRP